jgi:hypothetical protein
VLQHRGRRGARRRALGRWRRGGLEEAVSAATHIIGRRRHEMVLGPGDTGVWSLGAAGAWRGRGDSGRKDILTRRETGWV